MKTVPKVNMIHNLYGYKGGARAGSIYDENGLSPSITIMDGGHTQPMITDATMEETKTENFMDQMRGHDITLPEELRGKKYRIRKLTPRECMRLMDVDDADIDKMMSAGLSNSALYKLAGNSIVVSVLYHIFRKMFIDADRPDNDGRPTQLTLF